jgi:hypothetical protein
VPASALRGPLRLSRDALGPPAFPPAPSDAQGFRHRRQGSRLGLGLLRLTGGFACFRALGLLALALFSQSLALLDSVQRDGSFRLIFVDLTGDQHQVAYKSINETLQAALE